MQTRLIDGAALARRLREELKVRAAALAARARMPGLAVVIVGADPASQVYVRNKVRACADVGIASTHVELPASTTESRTPCAGGATQPRSGGTRHPRPAAAAEAHLAPKRSSARSTRTRTSTASTRSTPALLATGHPRLVPCTPAGVMAMLESEGVDPWGRHAVILGASNIVGKPVAHLLLRKGATVTICNSKTPDLAAHTAHRRHRRRRGRQAAPADRRDGESRRGASSTWASTASPDGKLAGDCDLDSMLGNVAGDLPGARRRRAR